MVAGHSGRLSNYQLYKSSEQVIINRDLCDSKKHTTHSTNNANLVHINLLSATSTHIKHSSCSLCLCPTCFAPLPVFNSDLNECYMDTMSVWYIQSVKSEVSAAGTYHSSRMHPPIWAIRDMQELLYVNRQMWRNSWLILRRSAGVQVWKRVLKT